MTFVSTDINEVQEATVDGVFQGEQDMFIAVMRPLLAMACVQGHLRPVMRQLLSEAVEQYGVVL